MANKVDLSTGYYPTPTIGRPLSNANIYVGVIDLDPEVVANQKQISVLQENGTTVEVPQPIITSAGGVPQYNGSPVTILVDGSYSTKVTDSKGAQIYYVPRNSVIDANDGFSSISDLRAISYTPGDGQIVNVLGYSSASENREWSFQWSNSDLSTEVANDVYGGIYVALDSDPTGVTGAFVRLYNDVINATWFGAGSGTGNDTPRLQAAYDAGDTLYIPGGTYRMTETFNIDRPYTTVYGDGAETIFNFAPSSDDICVKVETGITVIYQVVLKDIRFISSDTTYAKTAIRIVDCSSSIFHNLKTSFPHWGGSGDGSIFLHVMGRELMGISNIACQADRPIIISPIPAPHPAANIGIDQTSFENCYLVSAGNLHPIVEIETGVLLTQTGFRGFQSWIGGTYGLHWNDTTSTGASNGLYLINIRSEQSDSLLYHLVYINHNTSLQGMRVEGGQCGNKNGFYLRNVENASFKEFWYTRAGGEAMNIDSTVKGVYGENCFWQATSTLTSSGQRIIFESPKNPNTGALPPTFLYDSSANADLFLDTEARINLLSGQIKFPATPAPSTDVNTLDQYEEGTFAPTWIPASGSGQTITNAYGSYNKIGNRVFVDIFISTNGLGTASGNLQIGNFPYNAITSTTTLGGMYSTQVANASIASGQNASLIMVSGQNVANINIFDSTSGTTVMQVSQWGTSGNWRFSGSYIASE